MKGAGAERMFLSPAREAGLRSLFWTLYYKPCMDCLQVLFVSCVRAVPQPCPILCSPMDYSPPGSSAHEIFQARILEWGGWGAISSSRASSQPKD